MRAKMLVLSLLGILALIAPAAAEARAKSASRDGTVTVDVKIKRFARLQAAQSWLGVY